jgi:hypothetical protein
MFRLLNFAIIRLLHDLLEVYMCKSHNGWVTLASSRKSEGVLGHVVDMVCFYIKAYD